jgi:hypothetical protein
MSLSNTVRLLATYKVHEDMLRAEKLAKGVTSCVEWVERVAKLKEEFDRAIGEVMKRAEGEVKKVMEEMKVDPEEEAKLLARAQEMKVKNGGRPTTWPELIRERVPPPKDRWVKDDGR